MLTVNVQEVLDEIMMKMDAVTNLKTGDIPNIDLYMDQVTTFMDEKLKFTVREGDAEEKILTKTMINNYAKNDLLPPPIKKKYSKEHMMVLVFIYYFKNFLTISDIQELLGPLTDKYFGGKNNFSLEDIYEQIFIAGDHRLDHLKADLNDKYEDTLHLFEDSNLPLEEAEYLRLFSYICFLSYDVFMKKMLIERLVDEVVHKRQEEKELMEAQKKENKKRNRDESKEKA